MLIGRCGLPTYITLFRWAEDTVGRQPISGSWTPDFASMAELIPVAYNRIRRTIRDVNDVGFKVNQNMTSFYPSLPLIALSPGTSTEDR